jgi:hypothetical protein
MKLTVYKSQLSALSVLLVIIPTSQFMSVSDINSGVFSVNATQVT